MNLSVFHIAVMLATVFSVIAAGLCAARSVRSSEGYALGGRSAGVPMIAGSIAGTIVGGGGILKMGIIFFALFAAGFSAFRGLLSMNDFSAVFPDTPWLSLFGAGTDTALASLFSVVVGVLCTQTYVQAVFSAATPWEAAAGCFTAAAVTIPVGLPSVSIGMYMRAFDPNVLPVLVLPSYLISHESEWLAGIALGGILLSLIGSIGGLSLGIGTMIARDMAGEIFHIKNDKMLLRITKGAVLVVLIAASLVSAANAGSQVLFWNYLSMALRGGGIFLPLSLAIFRPGLIPKSWALASMLLSTAVSLLLTFFPVFSVNPLFAGLAVSAAVLAAGFLSVKTRK